METRLGLRCVASKSLDGSSSALPGRGVKDNLARKVDVRRSGKTPRLTSRTALDPGDNFSDGARREDLACAQEKIRRHDEHRLQYVSHSSRTHRQEKPETIAFVYLNYPACTGIPRAVRITAAFPVFIFVVGIDSSHQLLQSLEALCGIRAAGIQAVRSVWRRGEEENVPFMPRYTTAV